MSVEEFESQLLCAGYNEEQVANIKEVLMEVALSMAQSIQEVIERLLAAISSCWEDIKDKIKRLADQIRELLDIPDKEKPGTKLYVPCNPPTGREWYNQYQGKMLRDERETMRHFTIYRKD